MSECRAYRVSGFKGLSVLGLCTVCTGFAGQVL